MAVSAKTKRSKEKAVIEQMIALYCRKNHKKQAMCEVIAKDYWNMPVNESIAVPLW